MMASCKILSNYINFKLQKFCRKLQMFSTPQARAYFSQQIIKNKLVSEELDLMSYFKESLEGIKQIISSLLTVLSRTSQARLNQQTQGEKRIIANKIADIKQILVNMDITLYESNEAFSLQVNLRDDIKMLEQLFFKNVMVTYESKIKQLKHHLFVIEQHVQQLQQQGFLPYVDEIKGNSILLSKQRYLKALNQNIGQIDKFIGMDLTTLKMKLQNHIQARLTQSHLQQRFLNKQQNDEGLSHESYIEMLLKYRMAMERLRKWKINKKKNQTKSRTQILNSQNKKLKEAIQFYKQNRNFVRNEAQVRNKQSELTKEQSIDYLNEMSQDLLKRFQRRNIFLIISLEDRKKRSKSMPKLDFKNRNESYLTQSKFNEETEEKFHKNKNGEDESVFRDIGNQLGDSFLDQCSYLISDRFIADQEETEDVAV